MTPLGTHELAVVHAECGGYVTRIGPGDDAAMILDEITGHDVACPHARPGTTLAEPMAAGFMPHKVGRCWCQRGHDTDETIRLNRELTDALGLDRTGLPIGHRRRAAAEALGIDLPGVPAMWEDRRREFMAPDPTVSGLQAQDLDVPTVTPVTSPDDDRVVEAHVFTDGEHPVWCGDAGPHSAHEWNGGTIWCEGRRRCADCGGPEDDRRHGPGAAAAVHTYRPRESYGPGVVVLAAASATIGAALDLAGRIIEHGAWKGGADTIAEVAQWLRDNHVDPDTGEATWTPGAGLAQLADGNPE